MSNSIIGTSAKRWDAIAKVTGKAKFTGDYSVKNAYYGKILRSTIAHGYVKEYDIEEAKQMPGVIKILLPQDVPQNLFPTAGHPYSLDPAHQDIADRKILTREIRQYGDEIAAVIAKTELQARQALEKIKVTYEEYDVYLTPAESMAEGARQIHAGHSNVIADTCVTNGDVEKGLADADFVIEGHYETSVQQHVHMENQIAVAYQDEDQRWVCISSTQIPHICRRILGQALGMKWSSFRVKKPFIGGGFGNKQDVTIEPLVVYMSMICGGHPVKMELTREESLAFTRTRHKIDYDIKMGINKNGKITTIDCDAVSNQGGYASHGHSIGGKGGGFINALYHLENIRYHAQTVYTNIGVAGAMRGYGIPQTMYALESLIEEAAVKLNMDPIELRILNKVPEGTKNTLTTIVQNNNMIEECLREGRKAFEWDKKLEESKNYKQGDKRRGVGVASFSYGTGTYPFGLEVAGARLILIQDGSFKLMIGASEIGQGSDTIFAQMAAETIGVSKEDMIVDAMTDTDTAPFDTGAYASRQSYVTGFAVKEAAEKMKHKLLALAEQVHGKKAEEMTIDHGTVLLKTSKEQITTVADLAMISFYHMEYGKTIVAEASINCHDNSYASGVTFAEVEVDIQTGEVELLSVLNVHDSGKILNPLLASGQVEGGMVMGIAYGLSEGLRYNEKGKPLNNSLLDYKIPTMMDLPDLNTLFVESEDPIGPYGNKSLGENPLCSPAPAIRNAVLNAVGVAINEIPLTKQVVYEHLKKGQIVGKGVAHV